MSYLEEIQKLQQENNNLTKQQKDIIKKLSNKSQLYMRDVVEKLPNPTCCGQISSMLYYISPVSNSNVDFCMVDFDKFEVCYYKKPLERLIHQEISRCDMHISDCENEIAKIESSGIYEGRKQYFLKNLKSFHVCYLNEEDFIKEQHVMNKKVSMCKAQINKLNQRKKALTYGKDHYIFYLDQLYQSIKSKFGTNFSYVKESIPYNDIHSSAIINDIIKYYNVFGLNNQKEIECNRFIFF